ncbi:MAG: hypothetical protein V2I67_18430 [Thermoanaerobaculales bacterium]|nr:hypothetical protein [Thermoanaerobaculales bacterium]
MPREHDSGRLLANHGLVNPSSADRRDLQRAVLHVAIEFLMSPVPG